MSLKYFPSSSCGVLSKADGAPCNLAAVPMMRWRGQTAKDDKQGRLPLLSVSSPRIVAKREDAQRRANCFHYNGDDNNYGNNAELHTCSILRRVYSALLASHSSTATCQSAVIHLYIHVEMKRHLDIESKGLSEKEKKNVSLR